MTDLSFLPITFIIDIARRRAATDGIPLIVRQRGDNDHGVLLLKINLLNGTARLLERTRQDNLWCWHRLTPSPFALESDIEQKITRRIVHDPDLWLVEIEDKEGRLWFEGTELEPFSLQ